MAEDFRKFYESCRENGWIVPAFMPFSVLFHSNISYLM